MRFKPQENKIKLIESLTIGLASPDDILSRSHGEVTKPETINYRSFRPEKDGLFCEKIFGPVKDWECACGKYKGIRYKGIVCDRCGVEVTLKSVRRERMGHIQLAVPVVHIWFFKALPSKIGNIIGMTTKELEKVIYYESYVVINPGPTGLNKKDLISEDQYYEIMGSLPHDNDSLEDEDPKKFVARIGGDAIKHLLKKIDIEFTFLDLKSQLGPDISQQKRAELLKRLRVYEAFREYEGKVPNKPEWMVLNVVPVIPPELRPLVPLEGGRFATSDLNDLYRRVIIRNNRLKRLIDIKAPEVILRNEKRMLQEAVDALFDNSRRASAVRSDGNRPLKSLSDMLKGKQGRFRQNLLGKRVDYSGRSVIVVGPELKLHQCGLPKDMAVELFKPFIIRKLIERGHFKTVKSARKAVDRKDAMIWDILEKLIDGHPVMLNRAPTLHRLGIQAFQPILIDGKAIQLHPLVCTAFNADFDGDQMAVHVPLSYEAQLEASVLMLSSHNILSPQNGLPIVLPSQDIVLGLYYLTKLRPGAKGEGKIFSNVAEVLIAYNSKAVDLHAKIKVRIDAQMIETTVGRVIFNEIVPKEMGYINELLVKKSFSGFIYKMFIKIGNEKTAIFLDDLKELGYRYATAAGISISFSDMIVPDEKVKLIDDSNKKVSGILNEHEQGLITDAERYNKIVDVWTHTTNNVAKSLMDRIKTDQGGFNSLHMMVDSGARGSQDQVRQLAGMRGLMMKPQKSLTGQSGEIIENPIVANFKEGLSVLEYFISTHGARKGLADTALKTANSGYLTRRLVDVTQDLVVTEQDCGTLNGAVMKAMIEGGEVIEALRERVLGRVAVLDVMNPENSQIMFPAGTLLDEDAVDAIEAAGIDEVKVRTPLTCDTRHGLCAQCYGRDLARGTLVNVGEAVGVIAAQSIGEPGTQLTMRTFHIGGAASRAAVASQVELKSGGTMRFGPTMRYVSNGRGEQVVISRTGEVLVQDDSGRERERHKVPYGATLQVMDGNAVKAGKVVATWDPHTRPIITEYSGKVHFENVEEGVTVAKQIDEVTGLATLVVIDPKRRGAATSKGLRPQVRLMDEKGKDVKLAGSDAPVNISFPVGAILTVKDGQDVGVGEVLARIPQESSKTRDITGGLPRVAELFEARSPKDAGMLAEITGTVSFGKDTKGKQRLVLTDLDGVAHEYLITKDKHVTVHDGQVVNKGETIVDGPAEPHDILRLLGVEALARYITDEVQDVYRLQGVRINDKHIEVIVRQMLRRVQITDGGDTRFILGEQVERAELLEENDRLEKGKRPATYEHVLHGITKASLSTDSFISAASFQETTRVLTEAAIMGKQDELRGLKENVIVGRLIPAGTGLAYHRARKRQKLGLDAQTGTTEIELVDEGTASGEAEVA